MTKDVCGKCKYYRASKNKNIGKCRASLPYFAISEFTDWYVAINDPMASKCALYEPMWQELHEGCVVYE